MDEKKQPVVPESTPTEEFHFIPFSERIKEIRKEAGETQEQFAKRLGISKQILSLYEQGQRSPKVSQIEKYAKVLNVSPDYLLGDSAEESAMRELLSSRKRKPFYEIFIEVTYDQMGLDIPNVCRVTGLTDRQVRTIIFRQMKDAPLPIALRLSETLNVPLHVWTGEEDYVPNELSPNAYEVAHAYDRADLKDKNIARLALNLKLVDEDCASK